MKKYSTEIAAKMIVVGNTRYGISKRQRNQFGGQTIISSVLTEKAHRFALKRYADWLLERYRKHLKNSSPVDAQIYLEEISETRKQSTLDLAFQSIRYHLHPAGSGPSSDIFRVQSKIQNEQINRAYSPREIELLVELADPRLALSIEVAVNAGLRSMGLITLGLESQLHESVRNWHPQRFSGRELDSKFVVREKGGLNRQVRLATEVACRVFATARQSPLVKSHRGAHLQSNFDLVGGHDFSIAFGRLSLKVLGFSLGCHGLRHSFAQQRRNELLCAGFSMNEAINILSQELGHFSQKNTMAYLRDSIVLKPANSESLEG